MLTAAFAALMILQAASAATAEPADAPAVEAGQTADAPPKEKPEMICRREQVTGTYFRKRVCRTRAQIEAEQRDAKREFDRYFMSGARASGGSGLAPQPGS